jgi:hypothetical protein
VSRGAKHIRALAPGGSSSYDRAILAANPVAYWTLGGGSAGLSDRTGNARRADYKNGYTVTTFPDGTLATQLDGDSQYLEIAHDPVFSIPTSGILTIEAWMRPDVLQFPKYEGSGYIHWMGKGSAGQYEYVSRMYNQTNVENRPNRISGYSFNLSGGLGAGSYFQDPVPIGTWLHYVLVINTQVTSTQFPTGYTKIFKNGFQRDKDALSGYSIIPGIGTAPLRIGTRDLGSFLKGAVAKLAVYDYELPATTIRDHYQLIVPPAQGSTTHLRHVGSVSNKTAGTTLQYVVGDDRITAGTTLIIKVAHEWTSAGPTILDSRGNTYTRDQTSQNDETTMRASLFSAHINATLNKGDTIQLTIPASVAAKAMSIDAYSGILFAAALDKKNSNSGTTAAPIPATTIATVYADELITGFVAVNGPVTDSYTEDIINQYATLERVGTTGGVATSNVTLNSAHKTVGTTGSYRYNPTLAASSSWIGIIASYRAGVPVITPPVTGSAIHVQSIGSTSTKTAGTSLQIVVPHGGVPAGHTLIVRAATDYTGGAPTVTDSRGNTYTRDRTAPNSGNTMRASIFSCPILTPLQEGDTITLTSTSVAARVLAVDEFANMLQPTSIDITNGATNTSASPTINITTTNANDLLVGLTACKGPVEDGYTEDIIRQWTSLTRSGTTGSTSTTNITLAGAYRAAGAAALYTHGPSLGVSTPWIELLCAYRCS